MFSQGSSHLLGLTNTSERFSRSFRKCFSRKIRYKATSAFSRPIRLCSIAELPRSLNCVNGWFSLGSHLRTALWHAGTSVRRYCIRPLTSHSQTYRIAHGGLDEDFLLLFLYGIGCQVLANGTETTPFTCAGCESSQRADDAPTLSGRRRAASWDHTRRY